MWEFRDDAIKINNGASAGYGSSPSLNGVISVAYDAAAGKVWWGSCSAGTVTWFASGNPDAGTNAGFTGLTGSIGALINYFANTGSPAITANFGATTFACTRPTTFGSL
jgi:hypothetical protein